MAYAIQNVNESSTTALGGNVAYAGVEWHSPAIPDYLIYVFNISRRTFCDPNDPRKGIIGRVNLLAPGLLDDDPTDVTVVEKGKKAMVIPGNADQGYHYVTSFPQPMMVTKFNNDTNEIEPKETDGVRFVVDMISPDNLTRSLDVNIDPSKAFSVGNDYAPKGIFMSMHNPPLREDLQKAYSRMERYYSQLNEQAGTLEQTDKVALQARITSNPDHLYAANYYGKPFAWAKRSVRPVDCPNCGEQKPAGRLFHVPSTGGICVEATSEAWKQVVLTGNRTREQVPVELRWWKDELKQGLS